MGFRQAKALLAALISAPLAAQTYDPVAIAPQIIGTPQTMTPLYGGDDSTRLVQLGFSFPYYGQTFTSAWVSSNGLISFTSDNNYCCNAFPLADAQRNTIYGLWADLIGNPNPYYRVDSTSALFGWYGTYEYGSNITNTFEIKISADGSIQWNYGDVGGRWHTFAAGLTGPTLADTVTLFYGNNPNLLDNTSFAVNAAPVVEPEPVFTPVTVAPVVAPTPVPTPTTMTTEQQTQFEAAVSAVIQSMEAQAAQEPTPVAQESVAAAVTAVTEPTPTTTETPAAEASTQETAASSTSESQSSQSSEQTTTEKTETKESTQSSSSGGGAPLPPGFNPSGVAAGPGATSSNSSTGTSSTPGTSSEQEKTVASQTRKDRNIEFATREAVEDADLFNPETVMLASTQNIATLAQADAQYTQQYGEQTTTETVAVTYSLQPTDGPMFSLAPVSSVSDFTSPAGQTQQMELLNMGGMQTEMAAGEPTDIGDVNTADGETMAQLAVVPVGYSSYTQARIPDLPFYQPKDIYKGRRIPDANMVLYRMMQGQDSRWQDMVDEQYE